MQISDVIRAKQIDGVLTAPPGATVRELVALLAEHNIGAVVISPDGTKVEGIVSERDVVRALAMAGDATALLDAPLRTIMTARVQTCAPDEGLRQLAERMTTLRIRHVPVVDDGALVGVVSIGDVVKTRIDQLTFERDQLTSYVTQS